MTNEMIRKLCKAEGITSVQEFRKFFEYWIIGSGEMDEDFNSSTKMIKKSLTLGNWKKIYKNLSDDAITECLATEEEKIESIATWKDENVATENSDENSDENALEQETKMQMQDADCEYNASLSWEENIEKYANNPDVKKEEIKQAVL